MDIGAVTRWVTMTNLSGRCQLGDRDANHAVHELHTQARQGLSHQSIAVGRVPCSVEAPPVIMSRIGSKVRAQRH